MKYLILFLALLASSNAALIEIDNSDITGDVTFTNNNTYLLSGLVYIEEGESLTIEAGTVVKFSLGQGLEVSTLIVSKGGKIYANGTESQAIIFTTEFDDPTNPVDLPLDLKGLWGGIHILGNAPTNIPESSGQNFIEGLPKNDQRNFFGGQDPDDNSGSLSYVSIRYSGAGYSPDIETNGLSLAGVGSGTELNHIEVINGLDDGIEFIGGNAELKCAGAFFCDDDAFDFDAGYQGKGQFWFGILPQFYGDNGIESDGGKLGDLDEPITNPTLSNITLIASGINESGNALRIRDNSAGKFYNSIFYNFSDGLLNIEKRDDISNSKDQFDNSNLFFKNSIFYSDYDLIDEANSDFSQDIIENLELNNNSFLNPDFDDFDYTTNGKLNPYPKITVPEFDLRRLNDPFFTNVDFLGAFGENMDCFTNWSVLNTLGYRKQFDLTQTEVNDQNLMINKLEGNIIYSNGEIYQIMPNTIITKNDVNISYKDLSENDELKIDFQKATVNRENYSEEFNMITNIEVLNPSSIHEDEFNINLINGILKINTEKNYQLFIYDLNGNLILKTNKNNILIKNNMIFIRIIIDNNSYHYKLLNI